MAKTQTKSVRPLDDLHLGAPITNDVIQAIGEQLNWVVANRPQVHLNALLGSGDDLVPLAGWDDYPDVPAGIGVGSTRARGALWGHIVAADTTSTALIDSDIWLDADVDRTTIKIAAECEVTGADSVAVQFSFTGSGGTTSSTRTCTSADDNIEDAGTVDISGTCPAGEWLRLQVSATKTGTAGIAEVKTVRVQESALVTLADPTND